MICIVGGFLLIGAAYGLSRLRPPNWHADGDLSEEPQLSIARWAKIQRVVRLLNNSLIALIGIAIIASAFVPHGRSWMLLWSAILLLVLTCILFALLDAFSSLSGYRRALPEAARRSFSREQQDPPT